MTKRIVLLHAYRHSMPPVETAFHRLWPDAEAVSILDEFLYSDVAADGSLAPSVGGRLESLLRHAVLSGAAGIVFTGSTFGPAVDVARAAVSVPVLRADQAAAEIAVSRGRRILLVVTAARAAPVIERGLRQAATEAGAEVDIATLCIAEAKEHISAGRIDEHNRLIADRVGRSEMRDVVLFGQMSMEPALALLPPEISARVVTTPEAAALKMRALIVEAA